jgi:hypothetical protein
VGEILDLGVTGDIIEKSGSWFSYNSERIGQGRENAKAYLIENPDVANQIEALIRQNAGLIVDDMMAGPGDDSGDDQASDGDGGDSEGEGGETDAGAPPEDTPADAETKPESKAGKAAGE